MARACDLKAGETETSGYVGLTGQSVSITPGVLGLSERPCFQKQSRWLLRNNTQIDLWSSHIHLHIHKGGKTGLWI